MHHSFVGGREKQTQLKHPEKMKSKVKKRQIARRL